MTAAPFIEKMILDAVSQQSERDKQKTLGCSEIGGCSYCLGHSMSQQTENPAPDRGDSGFGYAAWVGTAAHYWMEHQLELPHKTLREHKVHAFDVEGYGPVKGTLDLFDIEIATTFDWKFPGKWSHDKVRLALKKGGTPSTGYRFQQQCYAHGLTQQGYKVERCVIVFFPRHSNSINDVVFWEEAYQPEMVMSAKERAETIWLMVQDGELDEIPSDPDCYTCSQYGR